VHHLRGEAVYRDLILWLRSGPYLRIVDPDGGGTRIIQSREWDTTIPPDRVDWAGGDLLSPTDRRCPIEARWEAVGYKVPFIRRRLERAMKANLPAPIQATALAAAQAVVQPTIVVANTNIVERSNAVAPTPARQAPALRNAINADLDDCIKTIAARTGGKTDRDTVRKEGVNLLKEQGILTTGNALVDRFQEPVHKTRRRSPGHQKAPG
jgi:hypothetical protein